METADRGFNPEGLLGFQFRLPREPYTKVVGVWNGFPLQAISPMTEVMFSRIEDRLRRVPGVLAAAGISKPPLEGASFMNFSIAGRLAASGDPQAQQPAAAWFFVTPGFFQTMRIPFVNGRDFDERDTAGSAWGVVINEAMARLYWPNDNPIGKEITIEQGKDDSPRRITGIVRNTRLSRIEGKPAPAMFVLLTQQPEFIRGPYSPLRRDMTFVARVRGDSRNIMPAIRSAVSEIAPDQALTGMRPLEEYGGEIFQWPRYYAILLGIFAGIATALAAVGIYGLIAYSVERRTREIGIRVAMGATRGGIGLLIMRQALLLLLAGLAAGLAMSMALTRVLLSVLWGVTATSPLITSAASLLLAGVALAASWVAARRALRVNPTEALRYE
jgi:putative ABC transport system permease protein